VCVCNIGGGVCVCNIGGGVCVCVQYRWVCVCVCNIGKVPERSRLQT